MKAVVTITDGVKVWEELYETSTESLSSLERIVQANLASFNRNLGIGQLPRRVVGISSRLKFSCKEDIIRVVARFRAMILACKSHDSEIRSWCKKTIGEVNDLQRLFVSEKSDGLLSGLKRLKDLVKESPFAEYFGVFLSEDSKDLKQFFTKKTA